MEEYYRRQFSEYKPKKRKKLEMSLLVFITFILISGFVGYNYYEIKNPIIVKNFTITPKQVSWNDISLKSTDGTINTCLKDIYPINLMGTSMNPLLFENQTVLYKKVDIPAIIDLEIGDIIIFDDYKGYLVGHRIIDIGADDEGIYWLTQGDNNNYPDRKIRKEQIKAVIVGVIY